METMSLRSQKAQGLGWLTESTYGAKCKGLVGNFVKLSELHAHLLEKNVLPYAIDQFKRFDAHSKRTALSVALALFDADFRLERGKKYHIALMGVGEKGAFETNYHYFQDYMRSGRKMGRGSLFVYTLPTSSLAETAIHFGLKGPLVHLVASSKMKRLMEVQENMLFENNKVEGILKIQSEKHQVTCSFRIKDVINRNKK